MTKAFGKNNPFYGKHHTPETIEKIRQAKKGQGLGRKHTEETKKKMSETAKNMYKHKKHPWTGRKHTEQELKKMSEALSGDKHPLYGKKHKKETIEKMIISRTGIFVNENNPSWKGDQVSYKTLHAWVRRHLAKPDFCELCGLEPPKDVANISGKYLRDLNDYRWLCRVCHFAFDGRSKEFKSNRQRRK